jgi:hypothetical protein
MPSNARPVVSRVTSMQPTLVREPFHRPAWVYEEKYDGPFRRP